MPEVLIDTRWRGNKQLNPEPLAGLGDLCLVANAATQDKVYKSLASLLCGSIVHRASQSTDAI